MKAEGTENVLWENERITLENLMQNAQNEPDKFLAQFVQVAAGISRRFPEEFAADAAISSFIMKHWEKIEELKTYFADMEFAKNFPQDVEAIAPREVAA